MVFTIIARSTTMKPYQMLFTILQQRYVLIWFLSNPCRPCHNYPRHLSSVSRSKAPGLSHQNQIFDVTVEKRDYDVKYLIILQKTRELHDFDFFSKLMLALFLIVVLFFHCVLFIPCSHLCVAFCLNHSEILG